MRTSLCLFAAALLSAGVVAHAETSTFDLSATLVNGSASGYVNIDTTTGDVLGGDVTVDAYGNTYDLTNFYEQYAATPVYEIVFDDSSSDSFYIALPDTSSLVGFDGSTLCVYAGSSGCLVPGSSSNYYVSALISGNPQDNAVSGALTPSPEPSSLLLLGTGVLGAAGLLRRRLA